MHFYIIVRLVHPAVGYWIDSNPLNFMFTKFSITSQIVQCYTKVVVKLSRSRIIDEAMKWANKISSGHLRLLGLAIVKYVCTLWLNSHVLHAMYLAFIVQFRTLPSLDYVFVCLVFKGTATLAIFCFVLCQLFLLERVTSVKVYIFGKKLSV